MRADLGDTHVYFDVEGIGYRPAEAAMTDLPVCFVLHGGPGLDHTYFKPWLSPLAEHMQLVYVDHRGNGRSDASATRTYTMDQFADDVAALRAYLGLDRIFVLGHSFGGFIAQLYALQHPDDVAGLILSSTAPNSGFAAEMYTLVEQYATEEQQRTIDRLFQGRNVDNEHYRDWWRVMIPYFFHRGDETAMRELISRTTVAVAVANHMFANEYPRYDVSARLAELISVPTLVLGGRHDHVVPASQPELLHELIPASELTMFEHSGHFAFIEQQAAFTERVARFVHERWTRMETR